MTRFLFSSSCSLYGSGTDNTPLDENAALIADRFGLEGGLWSLVNALTENFGLIGYFIIGLFLVSWAVSAVLYRLNRYDEIDVRAG